MNVSFTEQGPGNHSQNPVAPCLCRGKTCQDDANPEAAGGRTEHPPEGRLRLLSAEPGVGSWGEADSEVLWDR